MSYWAREQLLGLFLQSWWKSIGKYNEHGFFYGRWFDRPAVFNQVAEDFDFCLKIGLVIADLTFGISTTPFPFFNALVTYNALYVFRVSVFYLQWINAARQLWTWVVFSLKVVNSSLYVVDVFLALNVVIQALPSALP